ncbi:MULTISPECIES: dethiobiotin synthase [Sphingobacterium]|uniref:ATP-dependent dethiobiotin synthetase BioD n=1 Tax=Sphingobacterium ginsenosidimutans TaxID=687845 RepID=A0ABP8AKN8_9SPHI|nr:dethiobiotin synthase [Sphingobacterium sp. E70]ULT22769.1 dethiobiotin synthase [Sphingobacterium sp. E70]
MKNNIYFVSGIDTGIGKSYATGLIAKQWNAEGLRTITQKMVQTGNTTISEDITLHRQLMGLAFTEDDQEKITMPEIFSYPASPHLAAQIDKREIDFEKIRQATAQLSQRYDAVLVEGAGGLMVPLTEDYLIIDYIKEMNYPLLFVTSGKLGSINHTLLSLEAVATRGINLHTVIYNTFPVLEDSTISTETQRYLRNYIQKHFPETKFITL